MEFALYEVGDDNGAASWVDEFGRDRKLQFYDRQLQISDIKISMTLTIARVEKITWNLANTYSILLCVISGVAGIWCEEGHEIKGKYF